MSLGGEPYGGGPSKVPYCQDNLELAGRHGCALGSDGQVTTCWGLNCAGEVRLDGGQIVPISSATAVKACPPRAPPWPSPMAELHQLRAGRWPHLYCWGNNLLGELGGISDQSSRPGTLVPAAPMRRLAFVTYGAFPLLTEDDRLLERPSWPRWVSGWSRGSGTSSRCRRTATAWWFAPAGIHLKPEAFLAWLGRIQERGVPCCNSVRQVRWNLDKGRYLRDLQARGARLPATLWLAPAREARLPALLDALGSPEAVVKPAISLCADHTFRLSAAAPDEGSGCSMPRARARSEVLVQAFVPEVEREGELSFLFFGGRFSHALRKRPKAGDFRVQAEHGGTVDRAAPAVALLRQAEALLAMLPEIPPTRGSTASKSQESSC